MATLEFEDTETKSKIWMCQGIEVIFAIPITVEEALWYFFNRVEGFRPLTIILEIFPLDEDLFEKNPHLKERTESGKTSTMSDNITFTVFPHPGIEWQLANVVQTWTAKTMDELIKEHNGLVFRGQTMHKWN